MSTIFPDIHMSVPLKPSDRFLEYPFAIGRLPEKEAKVLDIGSAGSFFSLMVAALGYDVTACDIRPYEILNNLSFENFTFIQQDICEIPLPRAMFDAVTCISVLEHVGLGGRYGVVEDEHRDLNMAKQIRRVLKPGGRALITVPYGVAEVFAPYHRIYDYPRIKKIESGFKVVEEKFYKPDENDDWIECGAEEGERFRGGRDKYGLALIHLYKDFNT